VSSSAFIPAALSCSFSPFSIVELCVSFFSIVDLVVDSSAMSIFLLFYHFWSINNKIYYNNLL
jgi:hypothetical protein